MEALIQDNGLPGLHSSPGAIKVSMTRNYRAKYFKRSNE